MRNLQGAVDGAESDKSSRNIDQIAEAPPHFPVAQVFMPPVKADDKVAQSYYGEGHVAG